MYCKEGSALLINLNHLIDVGRAVAGSNNFCGILYPKLEERTGVMSVLKLRQKLSKSLSTINGCSNNIHLLKPDLLIIDDFALK